MADAAEPKIIMECPVCCHYYGRERNIIERDGKWTCASNDPREERDCGFHIPIGTAQSEVNRLADQRISELYEMGAPKV